MKERLLSVFKRILELENIDENIAQSNCDIWDSIFHLSLMVEIESEFDITFSPSEIAELNNFEMILNLLVVKLNI